MYSGIQVLSYGTVVFKCYCMVQWYSSVIVWYSGISVVLCNHTWFPLNGFSNTGLTSVKMVFQCYCAELYTLYTIQWYCVVLYIQCYCVVLYTVVFRSPLLTVELSFACGLLLLVAPVNQSRLLNTGKIQDFVCNKHNMQNMPKSKHRSEQITKQRENSR